MSDKLASEAPPPLELVLNSVENLLAYCQEQDEATGHDQGANFALGHMATIAAYFEQLQFAGRTDEPTSAAPVVESNASGGVRTPSGNSPEPSGPSRLPHTEERSIDEVVLRDLDSRIFYAETSLQALIASARLFKSASESAGGPSRLRALLTEWREHAKDQRSSLLSSQRRMLEICADELEALVGPVSVETKQQEETTDV